MTPERPYHELYSCEETYDCRPTELEMASKMVGGSTMMSAGHCNMLSPCSDEVNALDISMADRLLCGSGTHASEGVGISSVNGCSSFSKKID